MASNAVIGSQAAPGSTDRDSDVILEGDAGSGAIPIVDPSTIEFKPDPCDTKPTGRGRGRPRGSSASGAKNAGAKKASENDLTGILVSLHMIAATLLNVPELEISEEDGKKLNEAMGRINEFYGGWKMAEETIVWTKLIVAMGGVYGLRASAYWVRLRTEAEQRKGAGYQPPPQTINAQPTRVI